MRPTTTYAVRVILLFFGAGALSCSEGYSQTEQATGFFSLDQAARGQVVYAEHCVTCHGVSLRGGEAGPALSGRVFQDQWALRPLEQLLEITSRSMPTSNPGSLSSEDYAAVLAFVLYRNGYAPGATALTTAFEPNRSRSLGYPDSKQLEALPALKATTDDMAEWLHHRGTPYGTNYSPLDLIHEGNVSKLEVVWRWKSDNFGSSPWPNYQVTPLMAKGVLYATAGANRSVVAIDAVTGETLWMYRLDEGVRAQHAPRKGPGRGVALYRGVDQDTIFVISPGYQLIALDALTGRPRPDFGDAGWVDLKLQLGQTLDAVTAPIGASSPPIVVGDVVIVGAAFAFSGAPESPEALKGKVTAYDVTTGELRWRFNTIPTAIEPGADTWEQGSGGYTGNAGVWAPMSADPELGYVYLPVEAPTSDYFGGHRPGDNLYGQSLVCLNAATGERVWHFQTVHHPIWDYDLPAPPVLLDITVDGKDIPAVAQITKQGLTFVFDRRTGEPVWPIEERPVPQSDVPAEQTSPTQPIPSLPEAFGRTGVTAADLNNLTPDILAEATKIAERYTLGPLYTPATLFTSANEGTLMVPGSVGGANWQGAVADVESGVLYVSYAVAPEVAGLIPDPQRSTMRYVLRTADAERVFDLPLVKPPWGWISAIDLNTGKLLWQRPNSDTPEQVLEHPKLAGVEIPVTGNDDRSGLLVTKTLLFAGEGAGMYGARWGGSKLRVLDKTTGELVAETELGMNQTGVPMTYAINGRQYIVVATGAPGRAGELVALSADD